MRNVQCTVISVFANDTREDDALLNVRTGIIERMIEHQEEGEPLSIEVNVKGRVESVYLDEDKQLRVADEFIQSLVAASVVPESVIAQQRIPRF
ncbi:MAG: hypothetical protein CTY35_01940 [Methylotenera sp.]|uniref:hypothetical protein n=1 Tax=Methylotenera sp. TaxID=2051956 RepID=UPI000D4AC494|nr:hypothetical protein [Methylotenera sp.]PPC84391.1 MAG: hypothetical protein CTY38_02160 [Methylotenera sp.]PPD01033.1 MAG: hypothetical protein CTY35_01940 [Methylotenera sp.]